MNAFKNNILKNYAKKNLNIVLKLSEKILKTG